MLSDEQRIVRDQTRQLASAMDDLIAEALPGSDRVARRRAAQACAEYVRDSTVQTMVQADLLHRQVSRLRMRTHEIQAAEMGKRAHMEARLAYYDRLRDEVLSWLPRTGPGSSVYGCHQAMLLCAERDEAVLHAQALQDRLDDLAAEQERRA